MNSDFFAKGVFRKVSSCSKFLSENSDSWLFSSSLLVKEVGRLRLS
jgi:hypothetical protein